MQVDEDFNIRFVKLVQKHKCLYDKKVPEYRNKDFQEKSWLEIASETRESVPHCKERWRNLRACLSRYIKQQNSSDPQHKPYYLTEHMQFVLPFLKSARQSISNNNSNNTNNNNFNYDLKSEVNTQDKQSDPEETEDGYEDGGGGGGTQNYVPNFSSSAAVAAAAAVSTKHSQRLNDIKPTPVNCIPDVPNVVDIEHQHHQHHHHHQRQSSIDERPPPPEPEVMFMTSSSTATERLQSERKRIKIEHHYADENSDMDFFKSILPDISNMNALQKRKFKIGVLELIDDVLDKYPERKSPNHHHHHIHHQHHQQQQQHQSSQQPPPPPTPSHVTEIPNGYWRKS